MQITKIYFIFLLLKIIIFFFNIYIVDSYYDDNDDSSKNVKVCEPSNYDIDYNEEYKIVSSELLLISYESQLESVNKMIRSNSELFENCLKLKTQMQNLATLSVESLIHQGNIISFNILKNILYIDSIYIDEYNLYGLEFTIPNNLKQLEPLQLELYIYV